MMQGLEMLLQLTMTSKEDKPMQFHANGFTGQIQRNLRNKALFLGRTGATEAGASENGTRPSHSQVRLELKIEQDIGLENLMERDSQAGVEGGERRLGWSE